jgi:cellobiose phosphorylase
VDQLPRQQEYFGLISNTAGGYSFYKDARLRRLTRYRYNNAPLDMGGRYLYMRDNASGKYLVAQWMPVRRKLDEYDLSSRHGLHDHRIQTQGDQCPTRYFCPAWENLEIWQVTLTNQSASHADLSLFSAIEFCLWDANDDATNFQRNYSIGQVEMLSLDESSTSSTTKPNTANAATTSPTSPAPKNWLVTTPSAKISSAPIAAGMSLRSSNQANRPTAKRTAGSRSARITSKSIAESRRREDRSSLCSAIRKIPRMTSSTRPVRRSSTRKRVKPHREIPATRQCGRGLCRTATTGRNLLGKYQVTTPDEHVNRMVNIWNAYQCMVTFNMSRSASYFESGIGRGMGFRDSNQDLLGFVHMIPERARERILDMAATQLKNGGAFHQYQPLTKRGNNEVGSGFNDDPAWLVLGVAPTSKRAATGAFSTSRCSMKTNPADESPLYEHLQRALQYTLDRLGPNNLPLIGRADWNDCLNLNCFSDTPGQSFQTTNKDGKVAESVFIAGLFVLACKEMGLANYRIRN